MADERKLTDNFWNAVLQAVEADFGRNHSRACRHLGINKNRTHEAAIARDSGTAYPRPHPEKVLAPCILNGSPEVSHAAQELLEFRCGSPAQPVDDFNFLYAGMQMLLASQDSLLRAAIANFASNQLELHAASDLIAAYVQGHLYWALAHLPGEKIMPCLPDELRSPSKSGRHDALAKELLELASADEVRLFHRLNSFEEISGTESEEPNALHDCAAAVIEAYSRHYSTYQVARTFVTDSENNSALKRRPLYRLALEIYKRLENRDPALRTGVGRAIEVLKESKREDAVAAVQYVNLVAKCVTGNKPFSWHGEREIVTLNKEGVRLTPLQRTSRYLPRSERVTARAYTPLEGTEGPDDSGEMIWIIDETKYNVTKVEKPLEYPYDKISLIVDHKLNSPRRKARKSNGHTEQSQE